MPQHHQNHSPHAIGILLNSSLRKLEAILIMQCKAFKTVFNHVCTHRHQVSCSEGL